jgi:hypothetical protein
MRYLKRHLPSTDLDELVRLVADARDPVLVDRLISKVSMLSPQAIYEVENVVGCFPRVIAHRLSLSWFWRTADSILKIDPIYAPVLMFNRSGHAREAALKAIKQLPDTSFFLAALVWRLNDWVEPVRRAAAECANRELPRLSIGTIVGAAPFLLERMPYWRRWSSPPAIVLDTLARPDCLDELVGKFASTVEISAAALSTALRYGLLDNHLLSMSRTARRPEFRAMVLKTMLDSEVTWVTRYERQWVDKRYGITRRVPVLGRRSIVRPAPLHTLFRQGATDRSPLVRRVAAHGLVQHATSLGDIEPFIRLFDNDKSPSVRWNIEYLMRRH